MKKIKLNIVLYLALMLCAIKLNAQEFGYIPPSPQSFSFVKATGVVSENEHVGAANINIPLFTFTSDKLTTDINLIYNGTGVKVDDLPSDVGMTWVLNAGGVVTRTVNGLRDEFATMRMNKTEAQIAQTTASDCDADDEIRYACYTPQQIDTERDVFEFRFADVSGSFYLDENFIPVFLKNDSEVKIKNINLNNSTNNRQFEGFEITAINGLKYVFGGSLDFQEKTASKAMPDHPAGEYATTSYFLKEIQHPNGEKIFFTYNDTSLETKRMFEIHLRYLFSNVNTTSLGNFVPDMDQDLKVSTQTLFTKNKKRIQAISNNWNTDAINFVYNNTSNSEYKTFLSSIEYKTNNEIFKKITFDYLFEPVIYQNSLSERFYLTNISFYNKTIFDRKYQFTYNDPLALPKRLSYEQDLFGYYNGKQNTSLITGFYGNTEPISPIYEQTGILSTFGDRTPDFIYASKGVLTEVTYPTGGKTTFTYECPKKKALAYTSVGLPDLFTEDGTKHIIENLTQDLSIEFKLAMYGNMNNHMKHVSFKIKDLDTNTELYAGGGIVNYTYHESIYNFSFLKGKRYLVDFVEYPYSDLTFSYPHEIKVDGLGIRLKAIEDSENGDVKNYKRFYYSPVNSYTDVNNVDFLKTQPTIQNTTFFQNHNDGFQTGVITVSYALHTSDNSNDLYNSRLQERYPIVSCSMGGDHFENGGYEKEFRKDNNDPLNKIRPSEGPGYGSGSPSSGEVGYLNAEMTQNYYINMLYTTYFPSKGNRLSYSGTINNIKYFNKKDGQIFKNKQIEYRRNYNILGYNTNLFVSHVMSDPRLAHCGTIEVPRISPFFISTYKNYIVDTKLRKETITDFVDPIPVYQYNIPNQHALDSIAHANARKLITTTDYSYGNSLHNQVTKQIVTTSDNSVTETSYQYAHEKGNQKLISANMIGIPLETVVLEKQNAADAGKLVSKSEVIYPDQSTYPTPEAGNLLLPLSVKTYDMLSPSSFTEVKYNKYDEKGNLVQYTTKEGKVVTIIWGYNKTLPIAKIEGVDYVTISDAYLDADIVTASNQDANPSAYNLTAEATEQNLISKLDLFRSHEVLSRYLITTYSYDLLIGVRSITPPSGIREVYKYDSSNRLERIENVEGKVLKTYQYHYKN